MNLFWRRGVRVPILSKVFQCSRNTIYYNCLTGDAPSYPNSNRADEINALIDKMGEQKPSLGSVCHRDHDPRGQRREQGIGRAQARPARRA